MRYFFFLLSFFAFWSHGTYGQGAGLDTLATTYNRWRSSTFDEKIYVHTDRSSYLTGETLWFKAYRVDATGHHFIDWSKILYVELIDKNQTPVLQARFSLDRDGTDGSLFLPSSLPSGNYILRAYTNWMKNTGPEFFFHQAITILNPFVPLESLKDSISNRSDYDVQFFPEGGDLVMGLESVIGVRASDRGGHGIAVKGAIVNTQNDTIVKFTTSQLGLGKFRFTPHANSAVSVIVIDRTNKVYRYPLPVAKPEGYVVNIRDGGDQKIEVLIKTTIQQPEIIYLLAHTRQALKVQQQVTLQGGQAKFEFDKRLLGAGVSVITIFDGHLQAQCERLYFRNPDDKLEIGVTGNPYLIKSREPVNLNLSFGSENQMQQEGAFSVAVYKLDSLDLPVENITEYVWLTSDLSGQVENPAHYFGPASPGLQDDIDNLMLTHGWRRFNWEAIRQNNMRSPFLPEIGGHLVVGSITAKTSGKLADRIPVYLSFMGSPVNTYISQSQNGRILFETELITGYRSMIVQTDPASTDRFRIDIDDPFLAKFSRSVPRFTLTDKQIRALEQRSIHMQVQNLFYGNTDVKEVQYPYAAFYGKPDETYQLDDYTRFPTLEEVMREYVPGVRVKKKKDDFHLSIIDQVNKVSFSDDPLVLVDGVPVFDINKLMEIDPLKLKQLDVVKKRWYLNAMAYEGIVSFRSYKGDLGGYLPPEQALLMNYKGLEAKREFFSPKYSAGKTGTETLPDARRVLFWSTGTLQNIRQPIFFTSDIAGEYRIVVQALTDTGLPGFYSTTFVVK